MPSVRAKLFKQETTDAICNARLTSLSTLQPLDSLWVEVLKHCLFLYHLCTYVTRGL